jgi:hypothetical protein
MYVLKASDFQRPNFIITSSDKARMEKLVAQPIRNEWEL